MIRFANAHFILLFCFLLGIIIFYIWSFGKARRIRESFADKGLLDELAASLSLKKRRVKAVLIITALFLSLISLMRPQWGFHWQEVKRKGLDILIAIDVSKSMLANDVKPNRLERSKLAVKDLLKKLEGDRIGLIAFSGAAFLQCPLTVDYNGFLLSLDDLDISTIPYGGTSIAGAIKQALKSYEGGEKKYKVLILITDGEDHQGNALALAEEAKKQGIKIFSVGIGTKEGELIPIIDTDGRKSYLKDRAGNVVKSRLDEKTLQEIALATGGSYVRATGAQFGLELIYDQRLAKMEKRELKSAMRKHYEERFQIPLGIALILLLLELFINERKQ